MSMVNTRTQGRGRVLTGLMVVLILTAASTAFADTVIATADNALVWNRPSGKSFVVTRVAGGTKLDVVRRTGDWYEIVLPGPVAGERTGFIRVTQVAVDSVGAMSEAARRAATANAGSTAIRLRPAFLNLDATFRTGGADLVRTSRAFGVRHAENGGIASNYGDGSGYQLDALGSQAVWGRMAIGFGLSYYQRKTVTTVTASVPHPLFDNRPRAAAFETASPGGTEIALHLPLVWIPAAGLHVKVMVFGGPSVFRVSQDIVDDVTLKDPSPYDTVSISGVTATRRQATNVGFHIGGDVGYFFSKSMGVGAGARYSRATIAFKGDTGTTDGVAGATQIVAGLRFRY